MSVFNLSNKSLIFICFRYTAERLRGSGKQSIFNLGDEYDLTHGGTKVEEIDKFDNPYSDDDAEEEERLNAKFVEEAHFGGFMTKTDDEFKEGRGNTRKEWIETLIKESKKRKADKRKLDEETEEKTNELDDNWKQLFGSVRSSSMIRRRDEVEEKVNADYDPYDMLVRQLTYEKKEARGTDRLKTEDEVIKEEKEKLDKLEQDRLRRMRGEKENVSSKSSINVEDMNDGEVKKKNKMSKKEKRKLLKQLLSGEEGAEEGDEGSDEEEDEAEDESDGEEEEDEEDSDEGEEDDEDEDKYSDLEEEDKEIDENEKDRLDAEIKDMIKKASAELPYSFTVPSTYEEFNSHITGRSVDEIKLVLERILKCNHPSLVEGNKEKLAAFFPLLLQFIQDCAAAFDEESSGDYNLEKIGLKVIEVTTPFLFQLTSMFQLQAAKAVQEVVAEKFRDFDSQTRKSIPGLETLIFLKLAIILFPASDFRHPVVTPVLTFMSSILSTARPLDRPTFAGGLFLASTLTECVMLSKRFIPELVNFLSGIYHVCSKNPAPRPVPPCKGGALLLLETPYSGPVDKLKISEITSVREIDTKFKVSCAHSANLITIKLLHLYRDIPAASEIFGSLSTLLGHIKRENYPSETREKFDEILEIIQNLPGKQGAVVRPAKQVKMLRMMEPNIEENFNPFEKKRTGDKTLLEEQKLRHKVKQEKKGARKEIRKDVAFLANQKDKERRELDEERRGRTKALMSSLANQEGDYQTVERKKKRKF